MQTMLESDQIYERQLEGSVHSGNLIDSHMIYYDCPEGISAVWAERKWTDFVGQRSQRRHKETYREKRQKRSDHQAELIK